MTAVELLRTLYRTDFVVRAEGDRLIISPGSKLDPELRAEIVERKPELLAVLRAPASPCPRCGTPAWPEYGCTLCEPMAEELLS